MWCAQGQNPDLSGLSAEDHRSIEAACSTAKYVEGPAAYHQCLQKQLNALAGSRFPDLSGLSSEDHRSIEAACSTAKFVEGPAAYHQCLQKQLNALSGSKFPDLSGLSSEDHRSIEAACSTAKFVEGPAAYHQCLQKQLNALIGSRFPDLSGLSAEDHRSIEAACSTAKFVEGPAAYHQCLSKQLQDMYSDGSVARTDRVRKSDASNVSTSQNPLPAVVGAPSPQQSATPGFMRLRYFVGTWTITGEMRASSLGSAGKLAGTQTNTLGSDGVSVVSYWSEDRAGGRNSGQAVYRFDSAADAYTYHSVDASGETEDSLGTVNGLTWTWLSDLTLGDGTAVKGRFTQTEESAKAYSLKFEIAQGNSGWIVVIEGRASKPR
jgi:hypothetical protein